MIKWNKYFDKIYCINYIPMKERRNELIQELLRIGIDVNANYFSWKFTYNSNIYEHLFNDKSFKQINIPDFKLRHFNVTMAHYEILCEAKEFEYNRILILEDDVKFLKDLNEIEKILNNMPNDELILFDKVFDNNNYENKSYDDFLNNNSYYSKFNKFFISAACYSPNKIGINKMIQIYNQLFVSADFVWNDDLVVFHNDVINNPISKSFSNKNLAIQLCGNGFDEIYNNVQHLNLSDYK